MDNTLIISLLFILLLSAFLGYELIAKVPSTLHTPLMSGSNAISGICLLGSIVVTGSIQHSTLGLCLGVISIIFSTINVVGGYLVTDRMLEMFKKKNTPKK